jgi:hypothetical protein
MSIAKKAPNKKHKTFRQAFLPQQQPDGSERTLRQAVQSSSSSWGYTVATSSALCIHPSLQQERPLRQAQRQQYTARSECFGSQKLALSDFDSVRQISEHLRSASLEINRLDGGKHHVSFIVATNQQDFISEHSLIAKT